MKIAIPHCETVLEAHHPRSIAQIREISSALAMTQTAANRRVARFVPVAVLDRVAQIRANVAREQTHAIAARRSRAAESRTIEVDIVASANLTTAAAAVAMTEVQADKTVADKTVLTAKIDTTSIIQRRNASATTAWPPPLTMETFQSHAPLKVRRRVRVARAAAALVAVVLHALAASSIAFADKPTTTTTTPTTHDSIVVPAVIHTHKAL